MRLLCLYGSPRADGNSSAIADRLCDRAAALGARIEKVPLARLSYSGCQNLFMCKTALEHCGLQDDLSEVLMAVREADVIVMASPVYFTDVSSQLKACIDRFFSFFVPEYVTNPQKSRLAPGKKLVFIQTQGEPESACSDIFSRYERPFKMLGFEDMHLIRVCGVRNPGDLDQRPEVMVEAELLAERLLAKQAGKG